jgi:SAM-dependent methyltransferase
MSFGAEYARYYDIFYKDKPYEQEAQFLSQVFQGANIKTVTDIACGTGEHIKYLDALGYQVRGHDISQPMLDRASTKLFCPLLRAPMEGFPISPKSDAIIAMFNSIGYSETPETVFKRVREALSDNGVFVFDFWNKAAVLKNFKPVRERYYGDGMYPFLKRVSLSKLVDEDTMEVEFITYNLYGDKEIDWNQKPSKETHTIYFYDSEDVRINLETLGFGAEMFPFMKPSFAVTSNDWSVQCVAQKLV